MFKLRDGSKVILDFLHQRFNSSNYFINKLGKQVGRIITQSNLVLAIYFHAIQSQNIQLEINFRKSLKSIELTQMKTHTPKRIHLSNQKMELFTSSSFGQIKTLYQDTTNERCDKLMALNESMGQRNPNWKGKVKIVGISADDETEKVFQKVNENNWKSMEHYRLQDYWENNLKLFLPICNYPFIILINKWGKVVGLDVPSESNLEERINQEINVEQEIPAAKQEIQQNNEQLLTKEEFKYLKGKVYSIQEAINEIVFRGTLKVILKIFPLYLFNTLIIQFLLFSLQTIFSFLFAYNAFICFGFLKQVLQLPCKKVEGNIQMIQLCDIQSN